MARSSQSVRLRPEPPSAALLLKDHVDDVRLLWKLDADAAIISWRETRERIQIAKEKLNRSRR